MVDDINYFIGKVKNIVEKYDSEDIRNHITDEDFDTFSISIINLLDLIKRARVEKTLNDEKYPISNKDSYNLTFDELKARNEIKLDKFIKDNNKSKSQYEEPTEEEIDKMREDGIYYVKSGSISDEPFFLTTNLKDIIDFCITDKVNYSHEERLSKSEGGREYLALCRQKKDKGKAALLAGEGGCFSRGVPSRVSEKSKAIRRHFEEESERRCNDPNVLSKYMDDDTKSKMKDALDEIKKFSSEFIKDQKE
jgi:hypothetical protein